MLVTITFTFPITGINKSKIGLNNFFSVITTVFCYDNDKERLGLYIYHRPYTVFDGRF